MGGVLEGFVQTGGRVKRTGGGEMLRRYGFPHTKNEGKLAESVSFAVFYGERTVQLK